MCASVCVALGHCRVERLLPIFILTQVAIHVYRSASLFLFCECELFRVASTKSTARHDVYRHAARILPTTDFILFLYVCTVYMCISTLGVWALKIRLWVWSIYIYIYGHVHSLFDFLCDLYYLLYMKWHSLHGRVKWENQALRDFQRCVLNCWCGPFVSLPFFSSLLCWILVFLSRCWNNKLQLYVIHFLLAWCLGEVEERNEAKVFEHLSGAAESPRICMFVTFVISFGSCDARLYQWLWKREKSAKASK